MKKEKTVVQSKAMHENEVAANKTLAYGCVITAILVVITWVVILTGAFNIRNTHFLNVNIPVVLTILLIPFGLSYTKFLEHPFFKYMELFVFVLVVAVLNVALPKHTVIGWAACLVIASHFYNPRTVTTTFIMTTLFMAASMPLALLYGEWDANLMGITDESFMQLGQLFPDKPLPHGGTNPYDLEDRLYFLNHFNDYFVSTNRWVSLYAYYFFSRFVCLSLVYILLMQLNIRSHKLFMREIKAQEEKSKLAAELDVASSIQQSALPHSFPKNDKFDVYALTDPAKEVGGDFYNAFVFQDKLFFLVGDVSGKGIPASLFMMKAVTIICSILKGDENVSNALRYTNHELVINNDQGMFVTSIVGCLDLNTGMMSIGNAGHNRPLLKEDGKYNYFKLPVGFILGGLEGQRYERVNKQLNKNDILFLYTDGVTEAMNVNGELYGEKRLEELLNSLPKSYTAEEICNAVNNDVKKYAEGTEQSDDITMLCLKYIDVIDSSSFCVPADKAEVGRVTTFVDNFLENKDVDAKTINQIDVAVDEICSNIFNYAYKDRMGNVIIEIAFKNNNITIKFIDTGVKFNPLDKADPNVNLSLEDRPIGGLGIFMVKKLMDDVTYEYSKNGENILTITKKVGD